MQTTKAKHTSNQEKRALSAPLAVYELLPDRLLLPKVKSPRSERLRI